jgi:poly-gamma-glutamate capsule biosynthesis protein CapA/YwtB (metallophosphatase superfamily)
MNPGKVDVLAVASTDCCVLPNNHVLDWSYEGLSQTLELEMIPMRLRRFRLERAESDDVSWLARTLTRASCSSARACRRGTTSISGALW